MAFTKDDGDDGEDYIDNVPLLPLLEPLGLSYLGLVLEQHGIRTIGDWDETPITVTESLCGTAEHYDSISEAIEEFSRRMINEADHETGAEILELLTVLGLEDTFQHFQLHSILTLSQASSMTTRNTVIQVIGGEDNCAKLLTAIEAIEKLSPAHM